MWRRRSRAPVNQTDDAPGASREVPRSAEKIDRARLERALQAVAAIVAQRGGEVYLPIFERLERELATLDKAESALARARSIADAVNPRSGRSTRPAAPATDRRRI